MSETTAPKLLDVERLQQLSYERSTKWANFLDRITEPEHPPEISLIDMENLYQGEPEDVDDDLASMEDEVYDDKSLDSEVLRDITNSTRLSLMFNNYNNTSKLCESNVQDENNDLVDLFNQTIPVINEHNRQLKESGFERILNTFDAKKIEEKVGGWLSRHNSLYAADYKAPEHTHARTRPCRMNVNVAHQNVAYNTAASNPLRNYRNEETDSDDSFHSGETARYIRSSRAGAQKSSSSTTMMIKTYRMVKSTRQALKEKYACTQDDDAEIHLNKLRHRRRIANEIELLHHSSKHSIRSHKAKYMTPSQASSHSLKRKVLRKRPISNSCSAMETSSESDNGDYDPLALKCYRKRHMHCGQCHCSTRFKCSTAPSATVGASVKHSRRRPPYVRRDRLCYYNESHLISSSFSSSSSSTKTCDRRTAKHADKRKCSDNRPFKLESECHCCSEKRLCLEYKHLADSSTDDDWFVENSYCPKKLQNRPTLESVRLNSLVADNIATGKIQKNIGDKPAASMADNNILLPDIPEKDEPKKKKPKRISANVTKKKEVIKEIAEDSDFELQLQMALKASKEFYEKEQKEKLQKEKKIDGKKQKSQAENTEFVTEIELTNKQQGNNVTPANDGNQNGSSKSNQFTEDDTMVSTNKKNLTIGGTEETFFAANAGVCNSTAVPCDKEACKRQIGEDKETNKVLNTKGVVARKGKVIRKTPAIVETEEIEDDLTPLKTLPKTTDNCTTVKSESTKSLRKVATIVQSAGASVKSNTSALNDTTRSKDKKDSSSKVRHPSPKGVYTIEDGYVFVKPQGRSKANAHVKNDMTSVKEATFISGSQVICNSINVADDKIECENQANGRICCETDKAEEEVMLSVKRKQPEERRNTKSGKQLDLKNCKIDDDQEKDEVQKLYNKSMNTTKEYRKNLSLTAKLKQQTENSIHLETKASNDNEDLKCKHKPIGTKQGMGTEDNKCNSLVKPQKSLASKNASKSRLDQTTEDMLEQEIDSAYKNNHMVMNTTKHIAETKINRICRNKSSETTKKLNSSSQKNTSSNVTSTTIHSPDISKDLRKPKKQYTRIIDISSSSDSDENDCTVVSSTTNVEPPLQIKYTPTTTDTPSTRKQNTTPTIAFPTSSAAGSQSFTEPQPQQQQKKSITFKPLHHFQHRHHPKKGILIYTPRNPAQTSVHSHCNEHSYFYITKEHLSNIIGEKPAEKFIKYYEGRRRFHKNSTIYYRPPAAQMLDTDDDSSSDSGKDALDGVGHVGELYESRNWDNSGDGVEGNGGEHESQSHS